MSGLTAEFVFGVIGVATVGGSYLAGRSAQAQRANELKNDLLNTYDIENKKLKESIEEIRDGAKNRDDEQQKLIDVLRAEVDTWKNLPIKSLADSNAKLTIMMTSMASKNHELIKHIAEGIAILIDQQAAPKKRKVSK